MKHQHKPLYRSSIATAVALTFCGFSHQALACTPLNLTVTSSSDITNYSDNETTLREAVSTTLSSPMCADPHIVTFDASLNGETVVLNSPIAIRNGNNNINVRIGAPEGVAITLAPSETNTEGRMIDASPARFTTPAIHVHFENLTFDGRAYPRTGPLVYTGNIDTATFNNITVKNYDRTGDLNFLTGGAITVHYVKNPIVINGGTFTNNKSTLGAGVSIQGTSATLSNVSFRDNQALGIFDDISQNIKSRGGAIYFNGGNTTYLNVLNAEFINNHSFPIDGSRATAHGGAISTIGGAYELTIRDAVFDNNTAASPASLGSSYGGHISIKGVGAHARFDNVSFANGSASSGYGGAIYFDDGSCNADFINVSIANHDAFYGGAIAKGNKVVSNGCSLNFIQSTLSGGSATYGGALYHGVNSTGTVSFKQSTVTNNTTRLRGSAFYSEKTDDTLQCDHSVIADNGTRTMLETKFGSASHTIVNESNCFVGTGAELKPISNGGHTPKWYSPLVDASDPAYTPYQDTDQLGNPRIEGNGMDIGAVESFNAAPEITHSIVEIEIGPIVNGPFDLIQMAGITDDNDYILFNTSLSNLHPSISVSGGGDLTVDASTDRSLLDTIPKDGYISFDLSFGDTVNPEQTVTIHAYMKDMPPEIANPQVDIEIGHILNGPFNLIELAGVTDDNNVIIFDTNLDGEHSTLSLTEAGQLSIDARADQGLFDLIPAGQTYSFQVAVSDGLNPPADITINLSKNLPVVADEQIDIIIGYAMSDTFDLVSLAHISDDNNQLNFNTSLTGAHGTISLTPQGALNIDTTSDQSLFNLIPAGGHYSFQVAVSDDLNDATYVTVNLSKNMPVTSKASVEFEIGPNMNQTFDLVSAAEVADDKDQINFSASTNLHSTISLTSAGTLRVNTTADQSLLDIIPVGGSYDFDLFVDDGINSAKTITVKLVKNMPVVAKASIDVYISTGMNGPYNLVQLANMSDDNNQIVFNTNTPARPDSVSLSSDGVVTINTAIDESILSNIPEGGSYNIEVAYSDNFNLPQTLTIRVFRAGIQNEPEPNTGNSGTPPTPGNNTPPPVEEDNETSDSSNSGGSGGGGGSTGLMALLVLGSVFARRFLGKKSKSV